MVFLFVMPASAAFMNYLIPLMIGARDVAFPRLNALSWWIFFFGGIFLYSARSSSERQLPPISPDGIRGQPAPSGADLAASTGLADSPDGGWFGYQPNAGPLYSPGTAMDFWALGLQIIGLASLISSVNFIVTVLEHAGKGHAAAADAGVRMDVDGCRVPACCSRLPIIAVALFMVTFDRQFRDPLLRPDREGATRSCGSTCSGCLAIPEVYILILPAMGIVSEVLPVFSRKPSVRLLGRRLRRRGDRLPRVRCVGPPHVRFRYHSGRSGCFRPCHHDHRHPDRNQDLQLAWHDVGRPITPHDANAVRHRFRRHVHDRWPVWCDSRHRAFGLAADGHLLHRCSLPLRAVRWRGLRYCSPVSTTGSRSSPARS